MEADPVKVSLKGDGEPSGLAMMLVQYFEQNARDFGRKNRQARKLRGKLALEATEGNVCVTVNFKGDEIEIADGYEPDARLLLKGGIFSLTELAGGGPNSLKKILRGELKTRAIWRRPFFALRVARFMSLPREMKAQAAKASLPLEWKLALMGGGAAAIALAAYLLFG